MIITEKIVLIEITKNVYWEDHGVNRLVFRKGWEATATAYYHDGMVDSVSATSHYHGVSDTIREGHYKIIEELTDCYDIEV